MRNSFVKALYEIAKNDKNVFLVSGDMGYSVFETFQHDFPTKFINVGVAEANMTGIAAGLALSGKIAFTYSIVPFVTMRCFEQVRDDVCYQNANVKLVGSGGGLVYGSLGPTHHSIEDISIMRSLPNMVVICPGDPIETDLATKAAYKHPGPVYIRLGRGGDPIVHKIKPDFVIGKSILVIDGDDLVIISTGNTLDLAKIVCLNLNKKGISVGLISMHTVKPIDKDAIIKFAEKVKAIFTIEEHSVIGGLGTAVAEILAEYEKQVVFRRIGLPDSFCKYIGSHKYLREKSGLGLQDVESYIIKTFTDIK